MVSLGPMRIEKSLDKLFPVASTKSIMACFMGLFYKSSSEGHRIFTTVHCTFGWEVRNLRPDDFVLEPLVVSFLMIVFNKLKNRFSQRRFLSCSWRTRTSSCSYSMTT